MSSPYTNTKRKRKKDPKLAKALGKAFLVVTVIITIAAGYKIVSSLMDDSSNEALTLDFPYGTLEELCNLDRFMSAYLEAQGGIETLNSVNTIAIVGTVEVNGKPATLRLYRKRPDLLRISQDFGDMSLTKAFDGKDVWHRLSKESEPDRLLTVSSADKLSLLKQTQFFDWIINAYYGDGQISGQIEIANHDSNEVLKVPVENSYGDAAEILVDPRTMFPILMRSTSEHGQVLENSLSEYIEVRGVHMPSSVLTKIDGKTHSLIKITSAKINSGLLTDIFQPPAIVK